MEEQQDQSRTEEQPFTRPRLIDAGAVEFRTQDDSAPVTFENFDDNIVWGQYTEPGDEVK
jgi:hypothetical protein